MSARPVPVEPPQAAPPGVASTWAQDSQRYINILRELAETGAEIAGILHKRVRLLANGPTMNTLLAEIHPPLCNLTPPLADPHDKSVEQASAAYEAAVRSTRRTIMLAEKLSNPAPAHPRTAYTGDAAISPKPANNDHERPEIQPETQAGQAEMLHPERLDSLDAPDPEDDPNDRPIVEFVEEIFNEFCRLHPALAATPAPPAPAATPQPAAKAPAKKPKPIHPPFPFQPAPPIPPKPFPRE